MAGTRNHKAKVWLGIVAFGQKKKKKNSTRHRPRRELGWGLGSVDLSLERGGGVAGRVCAAQGCLCRCGHPLLGQGFGSGRALLKEEAKQLGEEVKLAETRPAGADLSGKIKLLFI